MKFSSMKHVAFCIFFFVAKFSPGSTVAVIMGDTATLDCYDPEVASKDKHLYVALDFETPDKTEQQVVIYKPFNAFYKWSDNSYQTRLTFLNSGQAKILFIGMPDEGMYICTSKGFDVETNGIRRNEITVYVPPHVTVNMITHPLVASSHSKSAAQCLASGGKPPAQVSWSSRYSEYSQMGTNETIGSLTSVSSTLQVIPTKSLNKQEFLCEIKHPAFQANNVTLITLNVTYPPEIPKILVDKDKQQMTCVSDGNPPPFYEWKLPPGATSSKQLGQTVAMIKPYDPTHQNDTYVCTASNSAGAKTINITTYEAVKLTTNQANVGLIVGIAIGAVAFIAILTVAYCWLFKRARNKDELMYSEQTQFVRHGGNANQRLIIQHENDSLHKQRPPGPAHPPPNDIDELYVRYSDSGSGYGGEHDVDLEAPVLPSENDSLYSGSKVGITSKASINFRKKRQGPESYRGSYRGQGDGVMQPQGDADSTLSYGHQTALYDLPPSDNESDFSSEPRKSHSENHPKYLNVDGSSRKSSLARNSPFEETVQYAQVNKQRKYHNV